MHIGLSKLFAADKPKRVCPQCGRQMVFQLIKHDYTVLTGEWSCTFCGLLPEPASYGCETIIKWR